MSKSVVTFIILICSVFGINAQWSGANPLSTLANVGIGTTNPVEKLQIGDFNNGQNLKISLPGLYNFEEVKLGQYGNGACGLEFINHESPLGSYGARLYSNFDNGITGLQLQTASSASSYNGLNYITRLAVHTNGNIGIGTIIPNEKLQIGDFNNGENLKISLPGLYNFEEVKLGQYGNGACGLEFINHESPLDSYGVRLYSNMDSGMKGLQIQTAAASSDKNLSYITRLAVHTNGNVGVGTIHPIYKLDVCGTIRASEVKVEVSGGCDFVFDKDYKLMDLKKLEKFIDTNKHLPEIASEKEMVENGVEMMNLQMKLLMKIEELTLYTIDQNKKIEQQNDELQKLKVKIEKLEATSF